MSKKTKAPKAANKSKSKDGVGSKDSVTGMSLVFDGALSVQSDTVYDKSSELGRYVLSSFDQQTRDSIVDWKGELEFGNKDYFVFTTQELSSTGTFSYRQVFKGAFAYKGKAITSARVDSIAIVSVNGDEGNGVIYSFDGGRTVTNPNSLASWAALENTGRNVAGYTVVKNSDTGQLEVFGDKAPFASFEGGKFFSDGWVANPFATNLI